MKTIEDLLGFKVPVLKPKDFKRIRKAYKKTQKEWANFLGMPPTTVQNWELGLAVPSRPTHILIQLLWQAHKRQSTPVYSAHRFGETGLEKL